MTHFLIDRGSDTNASIPEMGKASFHYMLPPDVNVAWLSSQDCGSDADVDGGCETQRWNDATSPG